MHDFVASSLGKRTGKALVLLRERAIRDGAGVVGVIESTILKR
jgi:hypothetical protein